jgi:hypothetical protein
MWLNDSYLRLQTRIFNRGSQQGNSVNKNTLPGHLINLPKRKFLNQNNLKIVPVTPNLASFYIVGFDLLAAGTKAEQPAL